MKLKKLVDSSQEREFWPLQQNIHNSIPTKCVFLLWNATVFGIVRWNPDLQIPMGRSVAQLFDLPPQLAGNVEWLQHLNQLNPLSPQFIVIHIIFAVTVISVGVIPFYNESSTVDRAPFREVINTMVSKIEKTLHDLNTTSSTSTSTTTTEAPTTPTTAITSATTTSMATTRRYVPPTRIIPSELPPVRNRAREAGAAITIIIISAILIVIIVITILVLLFNRKSETNYKLESHKNYNNNQNQAERKPLSVLLPRESHHPSNNMQSNLLIPSSNINNNLRMVSKAKRQDVKEWYV